MADETVIDMSDKPQDPATVAMYIAAVLEECLADVPAMAAKLGASPEAAVQVEEFFRRHIDALREQAAVTKEDPFREGFPRLPDDDDYDEVFGGE